MFGIPGKAAVTLTPAATRQIARLMAKQGSAGLRIGVKKGVMLTRDEFLTGRVKLEDRYFVYKREGLPCRVCNKKVAMEEFLARKLYWCPKCQR